MVPRNLLFLLLCLSFGACNKPAPENKSAADAPNEAAATEMEVPQTESQPASGSVVGEVTADALKNLLQKLKTLKDGVPADRPAQKDASVLKYEDMFSDVSMESSKLLERQFVEMDECGGDSVFTEYYRTGAINENSRTAIHFAGTFESGSHGIRSGMSMADLVKALGAPRWSSLQSAVYSCPDPVERANGDPEALFECGWFYFDDGKLIGFSTYIQSDC